jgi:hypothetical protein
MSFKEWLQLDEKDNRGGDRYKTFASQPHDKVHEQI